MDSWHATFLGLRHLPREVTAFEIQAPILQRLQTWAQIEPDTPRTALAWLREGCPPLSQQLWIDRLDDRTGKSGLVRSDRLDDHRAQITLAQHDQPVLIQPAARELQQSLAATRAREFIAQYPLECAALRFRQPVETERLAGDFHRSDSCRARALPSPALDYSGAAVAFSRFEAARRGTLTPASWDNSLDL